ncbi:MAG: SDR family oxidoreductase [Actinobacteria bacterium]|nr:SDR family oxidoreductase [Actinomycetota bacterium]
MSPQLSSRGNGLRRFAGQVAIVTGGGSGIGAATAARLAAEGATVVIADRDLAAAEAAAAALDGTEAVELDVSDGAAVEAVVSAVASRLGSLDVMVCNAGVTLDATVWDTDDAALERILSVNLVGAYACARSALRRMVEAGSGSVVLTSSDAGLVGWPGQSAYCASKGAIVAFVRAAALDAAPHGVRVNCVCPGFTMTPLVEQWIEDSDDPEATRAEVAATQPIGRAAEPSEIAAAIAFLASEEARFVTGTALAVDGGVTAR